VDNDIKELTELNLQFIDALAGQVEILEPILSPSFRYLDGKTGEVWEPQRYIDNVRSAPLPRSVSTRSSST
jgi:hypothetical protein